MPMSAMWMWWTAILMIFLVTPIGYGWGYRGWGPPYPSYVQRQRSQRALAGGGQADFNHQAWGWGGDLLWVVLLFWTCWVVASIWWR